MTIRVYFFIYLSLKLTKLLFLFLLKHSLTFLVLLGAEVEATHKVARCHPENLKSCLCKERRMCCFDKATGCVILRISNL